MLRTVATAPMVLVVVASGRSELAAAGWATTGERFNAAMVPTINIGIVEFILFAWPLGVAGTRSGLSPVNTEAAVALFMTSPGFCGRAARIRH